MLYDYRLWIAALYAGLIVAVELIRYVRSCRRGRR